MRASIYIQSPYSELTWPRSERVGCSHGHIFKEQPAGGPKRVPAKAAMQAYCLNRTRTKLRLAQSKGLQWNCMLILEETLATTKVNSRVLWETAGEKVNKQDPRRLRRIQALPAAGNRRRPQQEYSRRPRLKNKNKNITAS